MAKEIQKVAGSLTFICAAIPAGRVFIADLFKLIRSPDGKPVKQSHHQRISHSVYQDLCIFRTFLVECAEERFRSIPFLVKQEVFKDDLHLYMDAAGTRELGLGCTYGNV